MSDCEEVDDVEEVEEVEDMEDVGDVEAEAESDLPIDDFAGGDSDHEIQDASYTGIMDDSAPADDCAPAGSSYTGIMDDSAPAPADGDDQAQDGVQPNTAHDSPAEEQQNPATDGPEQALDGNNVGSPAAGGSGEGVGGAAGAAGVAAAGRGDITGNVQQNIDAPQTQQVDALLNVSLIVHCM